MGKSAGIWKKVKQVAKTIGNNFNKALNWANENLIRKNRNYIDPLLEKLPGGGIAKEVLSMGSDLLHDYNEKKGNKVDTSIGDRIHSGIDDAVDIYKADTALSRAKKINEIARRRTGLSSYETTPDDEW